MNYTKEYWEDLEKIQRIIPNLQILHNKSILITGANGMIGSAIVDFLLHINKTNNFEIEIFVAGRNEMRVKQRFGYLLRIHISIFYNMMQRRKLDLRKNLIILYMQQVMLTQQYMLNLQ